MENYNESSLLICKKHKQTHRTVCVHMLSRFQLFETLWTIASQAPLSVEFSTGIYLQEHWSGLPFPAPGDLPHPGIEPESPALQEDPYL